MKARVAPRAPQGHLSRAALFAIGAATAALGGTAASMMTGCSGQVEQPDSGVQPLYGGPPQDGGDAGNPTDGAVDSSPQDAGSDTNNVALYGAPPPDGGVKPAYGSPPPDAGNQPPYGQPPPPDSGIAPMYGAPPK